MTNTTINNFRVLADGKKISNDTWKTNLNNNDLVIGSSGSGKTGGYVIPNILSNDGTSMVVADTKSNLYKKLSPDLIARGYEVKVVDFVNFVNSCSYNPLMYIGKDEKTGKYSQKDITSLSNALIPLCSKEDAFWVTSAREVLACVISYVLEVFVPEDRNLTSVLEVYKKLVSSASCENNTPSVYFLDILEEENPDSFAVSKYKMFRANIRAEKCWASICQFITAAMGIFDFDDARRMFKGDDPVDFRQIGEKKTVVFLNISDTDRSLDTLVNIFYTQLFQALCDCADKNPEGRLTVPVRVFLDDFATNTKIEKFDNLISVIRSREISVSIILQSLSQLDTLYSDSQALTIINNCDHVIYLGGSDLKTAEYMSKRMCRTLERVLTLPHDEVLLLTRGEKGEQLPRIKPYSFSLMSADNLQAE